MLWSPIIPPCESDELQWESGGTHEDWNSLFSCGFQDKDRALTWQPRESGQEAPCRWYEKPVSTLLFPLRALHCSYGGRHFLERRRTELQDRAALGPCFLVVWLFLLGAQFTKSENKGRSYEHSVQNIKELFLSTEINRVSRLVIHVCQSCGQEPSTPGTFAVSGWDPQFFTPRPLVVLLLIALHLPPISLRSWKSVYEA